MNEDQKDSGFLGRVTLGDYELTVCRHGADRDRPAGSWARLCRENKVIFYESRDGAGGSEQ